MYLYDVMCFLYFLYFFFTLLQYSFFRPVASLLFFFFFVVVAVFCSCPSPTSEASPLVLKAVDWLRLLLFQAVTIVEN